MVLPDDLKAQMNTILGQEYPFWVSALAQTPPVSIRINPAKPIAIPIGSQPIPWSSQGHYLAERPVFTLDPLWHAGAYYVQEASSMLAGYLAATFLSQMPSPRVLDLCAAPGGKSTHIASLLPPDGLLVANEVINSRADILTQNLIRWGLPNTAVVSRDPEALTVLGEQFDLIICDAPCSGEGLLRKQASAINEWSLDAVAHCSARQKRILHHAAALLRPGGVLIYSTCTHNTAENEDQVEALLDTQNWLLEMPQTAPDPSITMGPLGWRCYPHKVKGEGFFISCLRKTNSLPYQADNLRFSASPWQLADKKAIQIAQNYLAHPAQYTIIENTKRNQFSAFPLAQSAFLLQMATALPLMHAGVTLGQPKGPEWAPDHSLALNIAAAAHFPKIELDLPQALRYLKKEMPDIEPTGKGWQLATYQNHALGWLKTAGNRYNNYLPTHMRIRMDIPTD